MFDLKEIEWEMSKLEKGESSYRNYEKLAILYLIRDYNTVKEVPEQSHVISPLEMGSAYSLAPEKYPADIAGQYGSSDFLSAVAGKDSAAAWAVMDELMDTLRAVNKRVYDSVMRKINLL